MNTILKLINPYRWLIGGLLAFALLAGVTLAYKSHSEGLREEGRAQVRGEQVAAENRALLNLAERNATLSNQLTEALNAYTIVSKSLADGRAVVVARAQRVRSAIHAGGELDQRLAIAECGVARAFGADAFRAASACRNDIAEIGLGPGGLVESAASAHYEHDRADALMRFSMPASPFTPPPTEKTP